MGENRNERKRERREERKEGINEGGKEENEKKLKPQTYRYKSSFRGQNTSPVKFRILFESNRL